MQIFRPVVQILAGPVPDTGQDTPLADSAQGQDEQHTARSQLLWETIADAGKKQDQPDTQGHRTRKGKTRMLVISPMLCHSALFTSIH